MLEFALEFFKRLAVAGLVCKGFYGEITLHIIDGKLKRVSKNESLML